MTLQKETKETLTVREVAWSRSRDADNLVNLVFEHKHKLLAPTWLSVAVCHYLFLIGRRKTVICLILMPHEAKMVLNGNQPVLHEPAHGDRT